MIWWRWNEEEEWNGNKLLFERKFVKSRVVGF